MPFVKVGYKRIHYRDSPPSNSSPPRETFILVHGLGSCQNYYGGIIPLLNAQNYRCVALDTTGSGRSPYTFVEQSIASLAADIIGVMDALSIDKAVVVGHSMAGITVPHLAAEYPTRVAAIVLVGPVYPIEASAPVFEGRIAAVEKDGMEAMAETVPNSAVGPNATPTHKAFIREILLAQDPMGYISMCRVVAGAYKTLPAYGKIQCPMLIVAGEEDKSAPLAGCQRIMEAVGVEEERMEVLKGIGHWMCIEAPEEVAGVIIRFFKQVQ